MLSGSSNDPFHVSEDDKNVGGSDDDTPKEIVLAQPQQGRTLLPGPAAAVVSGLTGLTLLYVRGATKLGGWGLYAGREATLKTLSVSRSALEAVLIAAGRDVSARSNDDLGRAETENLLERSVRATTEFREESG